MHENWIREFVGIGPEGRGELWLSVLRLICEATLQLGPSEMG